MIGGLFRSLMRGAVQTSSRERPLKRRNGQRWRLSLEILEDRRVLAVTLPAGFTDTTVAAGINNPTAMEFSPDGRLWALEQTGNVKLVHADGTTFQALHLNVDSSVERGLLGIAFDPGFASNHFVYLYYTNPNSGATSWSINVHNQLSRFTVNNADPQRPLLTNEAPILDWNSLFAGSHNGGAIHFGKDGMLYANAGDNVQTFGSNSYRVSQTLTNLLGKQLRIDVSKFNNGTATRDDTAVGHLIPADNPFVGTATGINQLIYVLGLRNPYTFAVQPGTGRILINDVGETAWEEIDDAVAGANYGWSGGNTDGFGHPNPSGTPGTYHDPLLAYAHSGSASLAIGAAIVGGTFYNPATVQFPASYVGMYFYEDLAGGWIRYFNPNNPNSSTHPDGDSVAFASNTAGALRDLKVDSIGNLYYLSGGDNSIHRISFQAPIITTQPSSQSAGQGQTARFSVVSTGTGLSYQWQHLVGTTWTNVGTNASTLTLNNVQTSDAGGYRVVVTNTFGTATSGTATLTVNVANSPPVFTTQPTNVQSNAGSAATFTVTATGSAPINYQWQFLVGGNWTNVGANSATYTINAVASSNSGSYRVIASNSFGSATSNTVTLVVNQLPTVMITAPSFGTMYNWGQTINFAGSATDPEDGTLDGSKLSWEVRFYHEDVPDGTGLHFHPFQTFNGVAGGSIVTNFLETSPYVWYRFILTATDSRGGASSSFVDIHPNLQTFTLQSSPMGMQLMLDGGPIASGTAITGTIGEPRTIGVVTPQSLGGTTYSFNSWSDGGAASHSISIPSTNTIYTANFTASTASPPALNFPNGFAGTAAQFKFNGASAKIVGSNLQLTDGGGNEAASIFALNAVDVTKFTTQFNLQLLGGSNPTADGMTFTIQGVANTAIGGAGGALGYASIAKSVAIKFDLYDNAGEGPNSTGLYTNGVQPNASNSVNLTGSGIDLHSGHVFNVAMIYDGTTLQVTITDTVTQAKATQSYAVNIPSIVGATTAYVGFTGGTGGLTAVQNVLNWTYTAGATATTISAPSNLTISSVSSSQVGLSWTNTDLNSTAVLIERKAGTGGTYAQIGTSNSPTANTFTDTTVASGATYVYRVRATNNGSFSVYSNEATTTIPSPQADLQLTNTDGQTTVAAGAAVTYTIVVSNAGPNAANGATVTDAFPATLTGVTFTATATGGATGFTPSGSGNINDTVNLPSGGKITYTVTATLSAAASGSLSNTAAVTAPAGVTDSNPANNSATDIDTISTTAPPPALNFPNGFAGTAAQFKFNGTSAKIVGSNLQLTDGGGNEAASIFALNAVDVTKFTTQFNLQLLGGSNPTADGMTFTIQGVANTAIGGAGGALGYASIAKSVAIKFDLYDNAGEGPNSTGLYTNGVQPNASNSVNLTGSGIDLHSGHVFNVAMIYNGTTLQVTITDTVTQAKATQSYAVNIPSIVGATTAYAGFTGGTGGLTAVQNVLNWTYTAGATATVAANMALSASASTVASPSSHTAMNETTLTISPATSAAAPSSSLDNRLRKVPSTVSGQPNLLQTPSATTTPRRPEARKAFAIR